MADNRLGWNFPGNGKGDIVGISDSGMISFKWDPVKSLAREIIQNSQDAGAEVDNDEPVRVEFNVDMISQKDIPGYNDLKDVLQKCKEFWDGEDNTMRYLNKAYDSLNKEKIPVLKISDFNTIGLVGADNPGEINKWSSLVRGRGVSKKGSLSGGSYGIGKQAPFNFSDLRTIFYCTKDINGIRAFQGVAKLVTFHNYRGEETQGKGFYGIKESNNPILNLEKINSFYHRDEIGTDIYIIGFNALKNWKNKIIKSVIENFFMAIYNKELIVKVSDKLINAENLSELIEYYFKNENNKKFYVDKYYEVLTSDNVEVFEEKDFEGLGRIEMYILPKKNYPKKVAMFRDTGMKIYDKGSFMTSLKFVGIFIAKGTKLRQVLREMEPPSHNDWKPEFHYDPNYAKKIRGKLYDWINEKVNSLKDNDDAERVDIEGMSQFFPDEEIEFPISNKSNDLDKEGGEKKPKKSNSKKVEVESTIPDIKAGSQANIDPNGSGGASGGTNNNGGEGQGGDYDDSNTGDKNGKGSKEDEDGSTKTKAKTPLKLTDSKALCLNSKEELYLISFKTNKSTEGYLKVYIGGEDASDPAAIEMAKYYKGENLKINKSNKIGPFKIKDIDNKVLIKLNENTRCSLEVEIDEDKV